jgi:hypothetical protein
VGELLVLFLLTSFGCGGFFDWIVAADVMGCEKEEPREENDLTMMFFLFDGHTASKQAACVWSVYRQENF